MSKIKMISRGYYYDTSSYPSNQSSYTNYPASLQSILDEYNSISTEHTKIISVTDNPTTKVTEMNMTDTIGGFAILLYEDFEE